MTTYRMDTEYERANELQSDVAFERLSTEERLSHAHWHGTRPATMSRDAYAHLVRRCNAFYCTYMMRKSA